MGKRSRKRGGASPPELPRRERARGGAAPRRRGGRPSLEDRPKPPWHPVPLVELCVLVGIVLLVLGALDLRSDRGKLLLVLGMALGSLGGLDTALREHLAGYRSHTTVISALPAVTCAALLYFAGAPWPAVVVAAVAVVGAVFWWMRRAFMRRAAGRAGHAARLYRRVRREAHAAARAAPRHGDLPRPGRARSRSTATCSGSPWCTTARPTTTPRAATCGSGRSTARPGRS